LGSDKRVDPSRIALLINSTAASIAASRVTGRAMQTPSDSREQLREYLSCLSTEKQAALLAKIERTVLRGESVADADLILAELRSVIRTSPIATERVGSPSRRFFDPVEPFIVGGAPSGVVRGQIARGSLSPIWIWISRDLLPKEAKSYSDAVTRALGADNKKAAAAHVEEFYALALPHIGKALASQRSRDRVRDRLAALMAPPRAMSDLHEIVTVLAIRHALTALAGKLPEHIGPFAGENLATARRALDEAAADCGDAFVYALLLVMKRLSEPWQLARLAANAGAGHADAATAPYRFAIMLVIEDTEDMVSALRTELTSGETETIGDLIERIAAALKGLESELDLLGNSWAARKLNVIRNEVRSLLAAEIEGVPVGVRRLFEMSAPVETERSGPQAADVAATEREVALVQFIRPYAGALGLDTKIASALSQVRNHIERSIAALLAGLRAAFDSARKFYLLQISHAVRVCARLFGKSYASAIVAATEAAVEDEQRARDGARLAGGTAEARSAVPAL